MYKLVRKITSSVTRFSLPFKGSEWTGFVLGTQGDGNKLIYESFKLTLKLHDSPIASHCLGFKSWF